MMKSTAPCSELMRNVDLLVAVNSVGNGPAGTHCNHVGPDFQEAIAASLLGDF